MRFLFLLFSFVFLRPTVLSADPAGRYFFNYTADCATAYESYLSLRLPEGTALLRRAAAADPGNLMPAFLADYEDCLLLMLNGDPREYQARRSHYDERLELLEKGPENSPWQRLATGVVHLHWALVHVRFGERVKAALAFRKSYLSLKENARLFPSFAPTKVFLGFEEALAGTIPEDYRWIASVFGVKGDIAQGVGAISAYLDQHKAPQTAFRREAVLFHAYLRFYLLRQQDAVWKEISTGAFDPAANLLHALVSANIALNYRRADDALQFLKTAQQFGESRRFPVVEYELGYALMHRLDGNATAAFERYLAASPGAWYRKDAAQKIAWMALLQGRTGEAAEKLKRVRNTGNNFVDADKQAQRAAESVSLPEPTLLAARLLCDGGFYTAALQKLAAMPPASLNTSVRKMEYHFRAGRTYEELGQVSKAFTHYAAAYEEGRDSREQFGARAALQTALLFEKTGEAEKARQWFRQTLSLRHHDFQASIDQQAKAGLGRLGGL